MKKVKPTHKFKYPQKKPIIPCGNNNVGMGHRGPISKVCNCQGLTMLKLFSTKSILQPFKLSYIQISVISFFLLIYILSELFLYGITVKTSN